ncbi:MAG: hypothetical protein WCW34_00845 [Patescibacteria group bacterium]
MDSTLKPCACRDLELCSNTGFATTMGDEILNGQERRLSCQQGFMILDIDMPWDPVCYPEPTPSAAEEHRLGIIAKFYR